MNRARRAGAIAILAAALSGVVACGVTTPPSTAPMRSEAMPVPSPSTPPVESPGRTPSPSEVTILDLGHAMAVKSLAPEFTATVLEHASTGSSVIVSAGPEDSEAAPDLYAVDPAVGEPELIWRNEHRDHSLVKIGGEFDRVLFVDMPISGEVGWNLWFIPDEGAEPILLDRHPGDPEVPTLAPSFSIYYPNVVWTAFDAGPNGPVSQLLTAQAPTWEPRVIDERPASQAEFWFPTLLGGSLVYTEIVYAEDGLSDERHAYLVDVATAGEGAARRLDASGLATMPLINHYAILWKEADAGFHMLNWGKLHRFDPESEEAPLLDQSLDYLNFPSIGERFTAWWDVDATRFDVYDLERDSVREILRYPSDGLQRVLRPHIAGSLLVWLYVDNRPSVPVSEIRYAWLPSAGAGRGNPP